MYNLFTCIYIFFCMCVVYFILGAVTSLFVLYCYVLYTIIRHLCFYMKDSLSHCQLPKNHTN